MPPLPAIPNTLMVRHFFSVGTDLSVATRLFYTYTGTAPSDSVCGTIASDIYTALATNLPAVMHGDNDITGVSVQDLTSALGGFGEHLAVTPGTEGGQPLAAGTAVLLNMKIARRYRGGKPRTYWPLGTANDLTTPSAWAASSVTAFHTALAQVIDDTIAISTGGTTINTLVNVSYYSGFTAVTNPITGRTRDVPKVRTAAITPDPFIGISVNPKPASQRRRNLQS